MFSQIIKALKVKGSPGCREWAGHSIQAPSCVKGEGNVFGRVSGSESRQSAERASGWSEGMESGPNGASAEWSATETVKGSETGHDG